MSNPEEDFTFYAMTNPGHWCPKCGQEQPSEGQDCSECYSVADFNDYESEPWPHATTPEDVAAIHAMWRYM